MTLKTLKRLATGLLSCVLVLSTITLMPLTAQAEEETLGDVDSSGGYHQSESSRIEVTEEKKTYAFTSTSNADVVDNYKTAIYLVYLGSSDESLCTVRSDVAAFCDAGNTWDPNAPFPYSFETAINLPFLEWPQWVEANKAGVECTITMYHTGDSAIITLYNYGVTSTLTVPTTDKVYVALSGENCKLTNIRLVEDAEGNGGDDVPGGDVPGDDNSDIFLDCTGWWTAHTAGFEITAEPHTYTFHSQTYPTATANWNTPVFVIYHSDDGLVNLENPTYREFGVVRSDNFGWTPAGDLSKATESFPEGFDWPVWQAANRSGVDVTVTTQLYNGHVLIGVSNNGVTTTYAIPADLSVTNYLSLSGEQCTLSNLQESSSHIDLSGAVAKADANNAPAPAPAPAASAPAADPAPAPSAVEVAGGGERLTGTAWWTGMARGSNQAMSGDGTWTWTIKASSLIDGYGAFSVEIYDPATNGYITTGSDMNAWTAEGFNPGGASVSGVAAELASNLVEGHTYTVTVTRSGNTFSFRYKDHTTGKEICNLTVTPSETVSNDVQIYVMAQVGSFVTAFNKGTRVASFGRGEVLTGTAWWTGMTVGSDHLLSGDGTWTWTIQATSLVDGYGAFSVEIYDPATNGYITTGSDMNAWTAEGFDPGRSTVSGVPVETTGELVQTAETGGRLVPTAELESKLVEGHIYAVTVTRSGNTVKFVYKDHTADMEMGTLVITPGETMSNDVQIHVMAQVGSFVTELNEGTLIASFGDSVQVAIYVIAIVGLAAIIYGSKKRFAR